MNEETAVLMEKRGAAFWITLNRPEKRNAISRDVIDGIREGYQQAHADPEIRVVVLTGAGEKAFCAGADLQPGKGFAFDYSRPNIEYADLLRLARNSNLPSIARVNGVCMAGECSPRPSRSKCSMKLATRAPTSYPTSYAIFAKPGSRRRASTA